MEQRSYIAIDLKSFYASVECIDLGLDPLDACLVVADESRTEKTICLAVSPALKACGIPGRARLFEVNEKVRSLNAARLRQAPRRAFAGESHLASELARDPSLRLSFVIAPPRMAHYLACSTKIYRIYMKYVSPEDVHVYSIDEVFIDATAYLAVAGLSAREFAMRMIRDVLAETGITATAGIGTNLYLAKIAMDIMAKRSPPDQNGVRIAELDEISYREALWTHRPLTDFWRVGRGYAEKLEAHGLHTMGDVARCSLTGEDLLYRLFGVNAELLIDHAWGWEPCTIAQIKAYRPEARSIDSGQVLMCPYPCAKALLVVREMAEALALDLTDKGLVTDQLVLIVGYDVENLTSAAIRARYKGEIVTDRYGRSVPRHAHGSINLPVPTSSARLIAASAAELFGRIADPALLVRRLGVSASRVTARESVREEPRAVQLDLFSDPQEEENRRARQRAALEKDEKRQRAVLFIQRKYRKNAILKGMDYEDGATAISRNGQIGGHRQ